MAIVSDKHLTEEVIKAAFNGTNFGRTDFATILAETVMKRAAGYHSGSTATAIATYLGLLSAKNQSATKLGLTFAHHHYYKQIVRDALTILAAVTRVPDRADSVIRSVGLESLEKYASGWFKLEHIATADVQTMAEYFVKLHRAAPSKEDTK